MPSLELIQAFLAPQIFLFLLAAVGAVAAALTMLLHPNPVRSALFLVLNLFCVAALYLLLNAYFLAAVQVVVYAGAIMVLFLFVIMLLNLGTPDRTLDKLKGQQPFAVVAGLILALAVGLSIASATRFPVLSAAGDAPGAQVATFSNNRTVTPAEQGTVPGIGLFLYNPSLPYLFPFEVTSILLLVATVGSVVLAKRRMPGEDAAPEEEAI